MNRRATTTSIVRGSARKSSNASWRRSLTAATASTLCTTLSRTAITPWCMKGTQQSASSRPPRLAVDRLDAAHVVVVDVHPSVGEEAVPRHVVLVAVAVDDGVDRNRGATLGYHGHRRVDDHRLGLAPHQQAVARRVGAVLVAHQHA